MPLLSNTKWSRKNNHLNLSFRTCNYLYCYAYIFNHSETIQQIIVVRQFWSNRNTWTLRIVIRVKDLQSIDVFLDFMYLISYICQMKATDKKIVEYVNCISRMNLQSSMRSCRIKWKLSLNIRWILSGPSMYLIRSLWSIWKIQTCMKCGYLLISTNTGLSFLLLIMIISYFQREYCFWMDFWRSQQKIIVNKSRLLNRYWRILNYEKVRWK